MIRTVEAAIDERGVVRLHEAISLPAPCRALVTILEEKPRTKQTGFLSENAVVKGLSVEERWYSSKQRVFYGTVVTVVLPVSDPLSDPQKIVSVSAVALAGVGFEHDFILCQITDSDYGDENAIRIDENDVAEPVGWLTSYARPGKLFTANAADIVTETNVLKFDAFQRVIKSVIGFFPETSPNL